MQTAGRARAGRYAHAAILATSLLSAPAVAASPGAPWSQQAPEEQIPVAGTFSYATSFDDTQPVIRGAVHAVRRIPGGTALYYSVGVP